jgi:cytochrome c553
MKQFIAIISLLVITFSCQNKVEEPVDKSEKIVYDMYEPSEMANLMNQMYAHNLKIKQDILAGETPTEFPMDFMKIHSAEMSDFKSRNETFESFSNVFLNAEREIFNEDSEVPVDERFNNAVNVCISCHQTECTGPIPRIQKLLIK